MNSVIKNDGFCIKNDDFNANIKEEQADFDGGDFNAGVFDEDDDELEDIVRFSTDFHCFASGLRLIFTDFHCFATVLRLFCD